jgi:ligand-binding sensor domain-containing protein
LPDAKRPTQTVSNEVIHDIKQDARGFIWIATANGLNRYDPRSETFRVWKHTDASPNTLPNALVWYIHIGADNQLWLVCDNRDLCQFNTLTETFTTHPWKAALAKAIPASVNSNYQTIHSLLPRGEAGLWLMTNFGLFSFDFRSGRFGHHPVPATLKLAQKTTCPDALRIGSWDSDLLQYDPCVGQWAQIRQPIPQTLVGGRRQVNWVFPYRQSAWVLGREGLLVLDTATLWLRHVRPAYENGYSIPTGALTAYHVAGDGTVWIGGEGGLWQYAPQAQHGHYTALANDQMKNFYNTFHGFLDARTDGRRYILDFYGGALLVLEQGKLRKKIPLPVYASLLYEARDGTLWVGSGTSLFWLNRDSWQLIPVALPDGLLAGSYFGTMAEDAAGRYWLGNNKAGLLVWNPQTNTWWQPAEKDGFMAKSVSKILTDTARATVWIATHDHGLFRYDEAQRTFTLYRHDEAEPANSLGAYVATGICQDGQGGIWVATDPGGISRFRPDAPAGQQFATLNTEDGLPSNQVYSVVTDANGNVWAGTAKGLAWVDTQTLQVRSFGKADGLLTDYLDMPLALMASGDICVGNIYGYQSFDPDSLLHRDVQHRVVLTDFRVFDAPYNDTLSAALLDKVTLGWRQNFFTAAFTSTQLFQAQRQEYAYRLRGFDRDWVYVGTRRTASYTNVPPGDYVLEIRTGQEGRWSSVVARLPIRVVPPFWARVWFRVLVVAAVLGVGWGLYRRRIAQVRQQAALKSDFNQRIARTEMAALRAQMNPHFVFNCLSSINRFILVNQPDAASEYLTKFSRLIRLILDNSRADTVPLDKELDALRLYLDMEQMRFAQRFEYHIVVADDVQAEHLEVPPLLLQPYVENAIWHGLMHKKAAGQLWLRIGWHDKRLRVEIEDDGIGRQRAMELKSKSATQNKSLGMQVTEERIRAINDLYGSNVQVRIDDLRDAAGHACGTRVVVDL